MPGLGRGRSNLYPTGGTPFQPHYKPSPVATPDYLTPPAYTFDPAIEAERRAGQRGLEDTEGRLKTERHFGQSKLHAALTKQSREAGRGRQDITTKFNRGNEKLGYERADTEKTAARRQEDFTSQLSGIARQFKELGHREGETANAAGVLDSGTLAASASARGRNQTLAEEPIHVGQRRVAEDLQTALGRLDTAGSELGEDTSQARERLGQDVHFDRKQAKREFGQENFKRFTELQQARREGKISDIDKLEQEIYESRANHPAAFAQWSKEHPGAIAAAGANTPTSKNGGGNKGGGNGGGNKGGGSTAPPPNKKKGKK